MSDGFLEGASVEQTPKTVEAPQANAEVDEVAVAEQEAAKEMAAENKAESFLEEAPTTTVTAQAGDQAQATAPAAVQKDEVTIEVEKILEDGLGEFVESMPAEAQQRFLSKGQEVSGQIAVMVRGLKVEVRRVVRLIQEWLLTIPGVNKFFLEQEAKIKTDRIIELEKVRREEAQTKIS